MTKLHKIIAKADVITDVLPGISLIKNIGLIAYKIAKNPENIINPNRNSFDFKIYTVNKPSYISLVALIPVLGNIAALIMHLKKHTVKNHAITFWKSDPSESLVKNYLTRNSDISQEELFAAHTIVCKAQGRLTAPLIAQKITHHSFESIKEHLKIDDYNLDEYLNKCLDLSDEQLNELCEIAGPYSFAKLIAKFPERNYRDTVLTDTKLGIFAQSETDQAIKDRAFTNIINNNNISEFSYLKILNLLSHDLFWEVYKEHGDRGSQFARSRAIFKLTKERIEDFKTTCSQHLEDPEFQKATLTRIIENHYANANEFSEFAIELTNLISKRSQSELVDILFTVYQGRSFPFNVYPEGNPFFDLLFDTYYEKLSKEHQDDLKNRFKQNMCAVRHLEDQKDRLPFFHKVCEKINLEME